MYERKHHPPVPLGRFVRRLAVHLVAATVLIALSLGIGMAGYSHYENLPWLHVVCGGTIVKL